MTSHLITSSAKSSPVETLLPRLFLLVLLPVMVYFNSLQGSFQFDDRNLLQREWIADLEAYDEHVNPRAFLNRPILLWTYAVNNSLDSQRPFGFHLVNLTLHVLVTILVFFILGRSLAWAENRPGRPVAVTGNMGRYLPLFAALVFALHPLNTDSVSYISSRSSLLATFFYLLTLYLFLESFAVARFRFRTVLQAILAVMTLAAMYLAVASKLIAATIPVMLVIWFFCFVFPRYWPDLANRPLSGNIKSVLVTAGMGLLVAALVMGKDLLYSPKDQGLELYGRAGYFLLQAKIVVYHYLKLFLFPVNLNADTGFPFTNIFTDYRIALSILVLLTVLTIVLKRGNVWLKAGTLWFFVTLAPTSSIIPLNDLVVEHRMYLPMSLGLCLIAGWVLARAGSRQRMALLIFLVVACSALTMNRNTSWISEARLWADAAGKNPNSPRVRNNLGKALYESGHLEQARHQLEAAVEAIPKFVKTQYNIRNPEQFLARLSRKYVDMGQADRARNMKIRADFVQPHYNLASVYLDLGQLDEAEREYVIALHLHPDHYASQLGLGSVFSRKGEFDLAVDMFKLSIETMTRVTGAEDYPLARVNLGEVLGRAGRFPEAIDQLQRAIRAQPSMMLAHYNLGTAYMAVDDLESAQRSFKAALVLNPNFEPALFNLGKVYQKLGRWNDSNRMFGRFIEVFGPAARVYSEVASNHENAGNIEQATAFYTRALASDPKTIPAHIGLGRVYVQSGQPEQARRQLEAALQANPNPEQKKMILRMMEDLPSS